MAYPAIYLDECLDHRLAEDLRADEVNVLTVVEASAAGNDDESQWTFAMNRGRVLVSQNQVDFRRLHGAFRHAGRPHAGIIILPQTVPYPRLLRRVRLLLDWVATFPEHQSRLFTWTELQQQIIHGFSLPGWDEETVRDAVGWRG